MMIMMVATKTMLMMPIRSTDAEWTVARGEETTYTTEHTTDGIFAIALANSFSAMDE